MVFTVTAQLAVNVLNVAVILVVPFEIPVIAPAPDTVAMAGFEEDHVTVPSLAPNGKNDAVIVLVYPTGTTMPDFKLKPITFGVTVSAQIAVAVPMDATMLVVPTVEDPIERAVIFPFESTVATEGFVEVHTIPDKRLFGTSVLSVRIESTGSETIVLLNFKEVIPSETVNLHVLVSVPTVAVMSAEPTETPVTRPFTTLATALLDDDQLTVPITFPTASAGETVATKVV